MYGRLNPLLIHYDAREARAKVAIKSHCTFTLDRDGRTPN